MSLQHEEPVYFAEIPAQLGCRVCPKSVADIQKISPADLDIIGD